MLLGVSPGSKLCTTFLNIAKHGEIMTKFQFTGTGAQPHRNRKLIQFEYAQFCMNTTFTVIVPKRTIIMQRLSRADR